MVVQRAGTWEGLVTAATSVQRGAVIYHIPIHPPRWGITVFDGM
jgi:hypothetical protein